MACYFTFSNSEHKTTPFALSLSKCPCILSLSKGLSLSKCPCILSLSKGLSLSKCRRKWWQGFDRLSPNGVGVVFEVAVFPIILRLSKDRLSPNGGRWCSMTGKHKQK
jgi:hypothetical protein